MTEQAISPLRRRMIEDMTIRKLASKTQHDYVQRVKDFAVFLGRSPDTAKSEDVRGFRLHLASSGTGTPKNQRHRLGAAVAHASARGPKSRLRQTTNGSEPNVSPDQSLSLSRTHVRLKNGSARPVQTEIGEPGFARDHEHQIARCWPQRRGRRYRLTLTDPQGLKVWSERPCKHPSCFWA